MRKLSRTVSIAIFIIFIGLKLAISQSGEVDTESPNIIVILTDDQGWGDLSFSGNTNLSTPNIDRLAKSGASFSNFYVSPVCSPTRAELLTGRYHPRTGVYSTSAGGERLDLDETTIAEVFKRAGYATGIFGKWHNGMQYPYHPNARGFDEFYGFASGHWGDYFSPTLLEHNGKLVGGDGYIANDFTNRALSFIEEHQQQPFFLYIPYNIPHSPMQVPDRWWNKFKDKKINMQHRDPEKEDLQFTRAALAMCENIDWNVGRLMDRLEALELEENTIVVYASDNGPNSWRWNGGMKGRKGSTDEGGVRSPLFIRWPGMVESGSKVSEIAAAIDLMPTLADLAGINFETNNPLDGVSLEPLLLGENPSWQDRLIFSHWNHRTSVRNSTYRLDYNGRLFNLKSDRGQRHDVSKKYPNIAKTLSDTLKAWENEVLPTDTAKNRPFPVGHPNFKYTQLPARDGIAHGGIQRSNRFPNASFFTNWTSPQDSITWDVNVLSGGKYNVEVYYTCSTEDVGSTISLNFGSRRLEKEIIEPHNPPLEGMKHDRVKRMESYVKDFEPLELGTIKLEEGAGPLTLKARDIPGKEVMDVRLLMFTRVTE